MKFHFPDRDELIKVAAMAPPMLVRLYQDGIDAALIRLLLLALAIGIAHSWALLFSLHTKRWAGSGLLVFPILFVVLLPGPVSWFSAIFALSFGAVFGREIFGGRAILPPALIGLTFAIFSFPDAGYELQQIFEQPSNFMLAASCLPGALVLILKNLIFWRVIAGALICPLAIGLLFGDAGWERHLVLGAFAPGLLFLGAAPEGILWRHATQLAYGFLIGALIILIRTTDPTHSDGIVFAILIAGLFAPLLDRVLNWRAVRD